ncbi:LCP family protein [Nocardioides sp. CER19]|uniref:LCP family protein n=1 Tax=Nocardioides sp. CER19 TaxID=3038538 RepID=UPI0024489C5F|nr:LCP family protein [Nocardioides sp. CER19]MDH2414808.1 LCP family protein [Nocardioides sp. CER19]
MALPATVIALVPASERRSRRPGSRRRTVGLWLVLLLVAIPVASGWYLEHRIIGRLDRIDDAFAGLHDRPARPTGAEPGAGAVNLLLVVTDHRADWATLPRTDRSDAAMLVHLSSDRRSAVVAALSPAVWTGAGADATPARPRTASVVGAVEQATRIRVDHVAIVDWQEFGELTDEVGGIELEVPQPVRDNLDGSVWLPGLRYFTGPSALDYARPRPGVPGDEVASERRQQAVLGEVLRRSLHQEMARHPRMLYGFLRRLAGHSTVDDQWSAWEMNRLVFSLRHLRSADMMFVATPRSGDGNETLWDLVRTDRVDRSTARRWLVPG